MSQEETWVRVTACENIPVREGRMIVVRGRQIAVWTIVTFGLLLCCLTLSHPVGQGGAR